MGEQITNKQIAFILLGIMVGYGTMTIPKHTVQVGGTTGWIWLILIAIISTIYAYMVWYTAIQFPGQTLIEYGKLLVGKWLGFIIIALFMLYYMGFLISSISISVEAIKLTLLSRTPNWIISIVLCLVIYYALTLKLQGLARLNEIYGIIVIISSIIIIPLMISQMNPLSVRPFFSTFSLKIKSIEAFSYLVYAFVGFEILYLIPLSKGKGKSKKIPWHILITILLIGCTYALLAEASIGIIGTNSIVYYDDALFTAVRRLNIPILQIFKRLDGIFFVSFIITLFTTTALVTYGLSYTLSALFKKISYRTFSVIILTAVFILTLFLNSFEIISLFKTWVNILGIGFTYTIPLILFIITKVRKYDKKKN